MRPRTRSIVSAREYFRQESAYATSSDDESGDEDNWMEIAIRGSKSSGSSYSSMYDTSSGSGASPRGRYRSRRRGGSNESSYSSRGGLSSWDENDPDLDDDDDDMGIDRQRTCSHDRRISFQDDVSVVTIPARSSFDAEYKRRVWYSMEDLSRMRQED